MALLIIAAGLLGPFVIALPIFPDAPTAVRDAQGCTYDAIAEKPLGRLEAEAAPRYFPPGQRVTYTLSIRNSGTCAWGMTVKLRREGGESAGMPSMVLAMMKEPGDIFNAQIVFTASTDIVTVNTIWRMVTPDGQAFGAPFKVSYSTDVLTSQAGAIARRLSGGDVMRWVLLIAALASPGLIGFLWAMGRSGLFMRDFYSLGEDGHGITHLRRLAFNQGKTPLPGEWRIVARMRLALFNQGRNITATAQMGKLDVAPGHEAIDRIGGPGTLAIHSGAVALLERRSGFSRIVWPGKVTLAPFERVRAVIDTRNQTRTKDEKAFTKDGIQVQAAVKMSFGLLDRMEGEIVPEGKPKIPLRDLIRAAFTLKIKKPQDAPKPEKSPEAIRRFVYETFVNEEGKLPAWEDTVSSGAGDLFATKMLDQLWEPDDPDRNPRQEMVEELFAKGEAKLLERGIKLLRLDMDPIGIPLWVQSENGQLTIIDEKEAKEKVEAKKEEAKKKKANGAQPKLEAPLFMAVDEQRRQTWRAFWEEEGRTLVAEGEARAMQMYEISRAEAQVHMIEAIVQGFQDLEENVYDKRRLSETIALRVIDAIERLSAHWIKDENRADYLSIMTELRNFSKG